MSILSDFEDRVGSAVEGLFAGAFRSPVQPAEVAKALATAMDDTRMLGVGKVYAPVSYSVFLSNDDADNLRGFVPVLAGELATYLTDHARERGYRLTAKPAIEFFEDDALRLGRFRVEAAHEYGEREDAVVNVDLDPTPRVGDGGPGRPMDTVTVGETGHDIVLRGDRLVVGRLAACDVCLADANVSRRHAEFFRIDDDWFVQDLGSTNGTRLNGQPVTRARLHDGDVVEAGITRLTYHRARE